MANTSFNFNIDPYYDDFEETGGPREQNYMRILFRPGYAVQARELTQLQTIIQNQIKQFGSHVFQDGSPVQGGHLTFDNSVKSLKLQPQYQNSDIDLTDFANKLIANTNTVTSIVRAQVLATDPNLIRPTLVFKYLTGNEFNNNQEIQVLSNGTKALTNGTSALANASIVSINEGVFYVDGYFVYVEPQTIIVDAYDDKPTARIGLQIVDAIIDESTDSSLLDPAQGSFNYQAPGATRYQFTLELARRTLDSIDDNRFFELIRVENGVVTKQVRYPIYSELEKTMARRTYDESGHYTVKPFRASVSQHPTDATKFKLDIEPGKAYVKGFEFETVGAVSIDMNKARTKNLSTNYSFTLDYGNYIVANNVFSGGANGFINVLSSSISTSVDLHAVPSGRINTLSSAAYSNTKIGTARIRNIDYSGSDTVNGDNYRVYLFDVQVNPKTVELRSPYGNTTNIMLPTTFSTDNDAYKNVKVRINTGTAADSYTRTITAYNGTTQTAIVDYPFAAAPDATTRVTLIYGVDDIDSAVIPPSGYTNNVYRTQSTSTANLTCMDVSVDGKTIDGKTILYGSNRNRLLYELPETYVSEDAFEDVEYFIKASETVNFTTGNATISLVSGVGTASWAFGNAGKLSALQAKSNFVVVDRATGIPLDFSEGSANSIYSEGSPATVRIQSTFGTSADVISTQKISTASTVGKTLITPSSTLQNYDSAATAADVIGISSSQVKVNAAVGHVWFTTANYIANTPGVAQLIYLTDVVRLVKVFDSQDISYAPNTTNAVDITNRYILDSGQRDNYYDFASIILKDGYAAPKGQIVVFVEYLSQAGADEYFSAVSYTSIYSTNKIPRYTGSDGAVFLRDSVDFRPRRSPATSSNVSVFSLEGPYVPSPQQFFEATYQYYVPRKDRLVLTQDKEFRVLNGAPSVYPTLPKVSDDAMILYNISIPAYTADLRDIGLEYIENKRYTMRDIGNIEKRVENLEYYTSLNVLELQAKNEAILYEDNVFEKEKYGIIVDDFSNFAIADAKSNDLAVNISKAKMGPYRIEKPVSLKLTSSTNAKVNDKTISASYSETSCVVQSSATKAITVQPYEFAQFHGSIKLSPESDYWYSTVLKPEVISVDNPEIPGNDNVTPVPELDASVTIPEETPDVGLPIEPTTQPLPSTGFGTVEPTINWFGSFSIGGGGVNSLFSVFDPIQYSNIDRK